MSDVVATLRAIVRHELARLRPPELGIVTEIHSRESDDADGNHEVGVRLQASGVELKRVPVTVGRAGLSALPNVDDLVLVVFAGGDLNAGVVVGCVYHDQARPPKAHPHEVVYQPPEPEQGGIRRLHIELASGTVVTADDDVVRLQSGGTEVVVNRDGDVTVRTKSNLVLEADGDIEVKASGNLALSAVGDVVIKGASATLEGQGRAKLKGGQVTLAGITQFSAQ